jgi:ParB family chromosome partitioning protein
MNDDPSKKRLGRGLAALIGEIDRPAEERKAPVPIERNVPIEFVTRNPRNPRRMFSEGDLEDLAQSIKEHGVDRHQGSRTGSN